MESFKIVVMMAYYEMVNKAWNVLRLSSRSNDYFDMRDNVIVNIL